MAPSVSPTSFACICAFRPYPAPCPVHGPWPSQGAPQGSMGAVAEALAAAGIVPVALDRNHLNAEQARDWAEIVRGWLKYASEDELRLMGPGYLEDLDATASFAAPS